MWWTIGTAANAIIAVAYVGIAVAILVPLVRTRQVPSNHLGTAIAAIFFGCAVHHGGHSEAESESRHGPGDLRRREPARIGEA